jgi:hypothetical protein
LIFDFQKLTVHPLLILHNDKFHKKLRLSLKSETWGIKHMKTQRPNILKMLGSPTLEFRCMTCDAISEPLNKLNETLQTIAKECSNEAEMTRRTDEAHRVYNTEIQPPLLDPHIVWGFCAMHVGSVAPFNLSFNATPPEATWKCVETQIGGLNADGLNADGLNADGLNADGLDADGLNADGLDADGVKDGVKDEGLDAEGVKDEGLDAEGVKDEGLDAEGVKDEGVKNEGINP